MRVTERDAEAVFVDEVERVLDAVAVFVADDGRMTVRVCVAETERDAVFVRIDERGVAVKVIVVVDEDDREVEAVEDLVMAGAGEGLWGQRREDTCASSPAAQTTPAQILTC